MEEISVRYFHNGSVYRLNGNRFDVNHVLAMTNEFQKRYQQFADEINKEGGFLEIHLSDSEELQEGIHYDADVQGISEGLRAKILKLLSPE